MNNLLAHNSSNDDWIKKRRETLGKKMVSLDFEQLMIELDLTVEQLAKKIGYTLDGTIVMLRRGTMKLSLYDKLIKQYPDIKFKNFERKK